MSCKTQIEYSCPKIDIVKAILKKKYLELEPLQYNEYKELCEILEEIREINSQLREKALENKK